MATDLSELKERSNFINWIKSSQDHPDILVNNVGIGGRFGRFESVQWNSIEKTLALNIFAFIHLTYEMIPILKKTFTGKNR